MLTTEYCSTLTDFFFTHTIAVHTYSKKGDYYMARRSRIYRVMLLALLLATLAVGQQPEPQQPSPASQNPASPEKPSPGVESKPEQKTENATPNEKPAPQTPAVQND